MAASLHGQVSGGDGETLEGVVIPSRGVWADTARGSGVTPSGGAIALVFLQPRGDERKEATGTRERSAGGASEDSEVPL
ncbi:MAG: hypothetical protein HIU91_10215 [Acidobacteria bacterium]|nr:hypothetical protein [Acidobacteriota bacterium]